MAEVSNKPLAASGLAIDARCRRAHRPLFVVVVVLGLVAACEARAGDRYTEHKTYTYKTVGDLPIKADVYRLPGDDVRPVIVWIHGGGLITGGRGGPALAQRKRYLDAGNVIVSIDYRLAPETKLPAIIEDVRDAFKWVRSEGPKLFNIDPKRVAVVGHSAGGYLTLMAGFAVEPRPQALIAFYGYGDVDGDWYAKPSAFHRKTRPLVSKEEAYKAIGTKETTNSVKGRGNFYTYCRQNGLWSKEVVGYDPVTQPREFDRFCPVRNVTKDYPPTLLLHGDKDTDVPYAQSVAMAAELKRVGVVHEFISIPGGGHGFDGKGMQDADVSAAFDRIEAFLKKHTVAGVRLDQPPADSPKTPVKAEGAVADKLVKAATDKGLDLLYKAGRNWQENKSCFSCHHQTLPQVAVLEAAPAGFQVDAAWLKSQADQTHDFFEAQIERMNAGKHVAGGASTLGYGLWSLMLDNRPADETTAAMVSYLLQSQGRPWMDTRSRAEEKKRPAKLAARVEGLWLTNCSRPPLTESRIGTTVLALIGMKHYATKEQRPAVDKAAEAADNWMAKAPLRSTEDHFWRLWGLHQFGGDAATKKQIREAIVAAQRKDGGWAQDSGLESDAYATGQMLFVLRETGSNRGDPVAQRAAAYLLRTQHKDGSWLVKSRVKGKAQPYFDNGDPYGKDQFISVAATSWATAALAQFLSPSDAPPKP
ncbi:MAG TPA: alpha/beta fold hydrolase [Fimbriiglobus sp.]|nr:alpha/beta fold hydrolase [Fimbriiglobus sp.]